MKSRASYFLYVALVFLITIGPSWSSLNNQVICIEANGHVAVEMAIDGHCLDKVLLQQTPSYHTKTLKGGYQFCQGSACKDIPLFHINNTESVLRGSVPTEQMTYAASRQDYSGFSSVKLSAEQLSNPPSEPSLRHYRLENLSTIRLLI